MRKLGGIGDNGILAQMAIFFGLLSITPTTKAVVCPRATRVYPCHCYLNKEYKLLDVDCEGPDVTQAVLNRVLFAIRRENNGLLMFNQFTVDYTNLVELDLTPFDGGTFSVMDFTANSLLSRIVGPDLTSGDWNPITAHNIYLDNNNFHDEGLQTTLSYFHRDEISYLGLSGNKLRGTLGQEFLPGFSNLGFATHLNLNNNNIRYLGGGQFRGLNSLNFMYLENNELSVIGEDAFVIDGTDENSLELLLGNNSLSDESFHQNSGIQNTNRRVHIFLDNNQFSRLWEDKFFIFLETDPENALDFSGNPIWCDSDMKWLKDRREELEERVTGLDCTNDPGETAFTTSKIEVVFCPSAIEVSPCDCYLNKELQLLNVACVGPDVTQSVLDRVLAAIRRDNNDLLMFNLFLLRHTNMTQVDLTPLKGGSFYLLDFSYNSLLSRIVGPDSTSGNWNPIKADCLDWNHNNFQDEGLQTTFSYFSRDGITSLELSGNKLRGTLGQEFLPGISELSGIWSLYLKDNNIRAVGGGQFRGMSSLNFIHLENNGLTEIGEDAFVLNETSGTFLDLFLKNNSLSDGSFHPNSGISIANRRTSVFLDYNNFTKVGEDGFLNFLEIRGNNFVSFKGNPIWCDSDMKWLKDRLAKFEWRVGGLNCLNDPGKTAFTTCKTEDYCEISRVICPRAKEVSPCDCYLNTEFQLLNVDCVGADVTQAVLDKVVTAIRRENNDLSKFYLFSLQHTNMTQVDLTPFEGGTFYVMDFSYNSLLSRIVGPDPISGDWNPVKAFSINWNHNNFQDEGLRTALNYFSRDEIISLKLSGNKLRGTLGQEFLPGFSDLAVATNLSLNDNNIRFLGGGQFRGMSSLNFIYLENNGLSEIGEDSFVINGTNGTSLDLFLRNNSLSDDSFHPNSGISNIHRRFNIFLQNNQFSRVSEDKFLSFLETDPENALDFRENRIFCDSDMKWLKDRREEFEKRVTGLDCTNDHGETAFTTSKFEAAVCPSATEVSPCDCYLNAEFQLLNVDCVGPDVTQAVLDRVLAAIRRENKDLLMFYMFSLRHTNMTQVNLTPFEGVTFNVMDFSYNSLLSRIVGPDPISGDWNPVKAYSINWNYNNFEDEGLRTTLSYFSRTEIKLLELSGNKLTGSLGQEFLPGISELSGVWSLYLKDNNIRTLEGGQFRGMSSLNFIHLENNGLTEVGEDAFVTHETDGTILDLFLTNNSFSDGSFHPNRVISNTNRRISIFLDNNNFTKVREEGFLNFLETTHRNNIISFKGNPIWCDSDMKWLKDRREEFEWRVGGLNCVNDPGKTAFTTCKTEDYCDISSNGISLRLAMQILLSLFLLTTIV